MFFVITFVLSSVHWFMHRGLSPRQLMPMAGVHQAVENNSRGRRPKFGKVSFSVVSRRECLTFCLGKNMADECANCRPATDAEKTDAQQKFFAAVQRISSRIDTAMRDDLARASISDGVVGMEQIPMFVVSFPEESSLSGFHFAFTIEHLLNAPDEEVAAGLVEDIERQIDERAAALPWWKRIFRR